MIIKIFWFLFVLILVSLITLILRLPAGAGGEIGGWGVCVPSKDDDCRGGFFVSSPTQCSWMQGIVCEQFEKDQRALCYGIHNPNGCIDSVRGSHFNRPIKHY
jgi:hypothetical protein